MLSDPDIRLDGGILPTNVYLFPNTQKSTTHVYGWDAIRSIRSLDGVKKTHLITASKQRHRISTIYATFEVPPNERDIFYKHMGHSKAVNEGVYQHPLPVQEVLKMGKHLRDIDQGKNRSLIDIFPSLFRRWLTKVYIYTYLKGVFQLPHLYLEQYIIVYNIIHPFPPNLCRYVVAISMVVSVQY